MAYKKKIQPSLNCGLDVLGEVLYGKWKIRLLYFINQGHKRPGELQRQILDASRRVLNMQLNELEAHELVTKKIFPQLPPKVEYSLTTMGESLMPIINALGQWGDAHQEKLSAVIRQAAINETKVILIKTE
ncbi:HxlR family transcriptional regulator [Pedobacter sp. Leaf216]|uniref:winged helix-turn-helix transcriptional regulator n=1 Tax=Pedobacter sp. Leaf216 TaxID=1735684 RepID=UPI0006FA2AA6|nr:helix-turn-helix domain-containing protein [Pedobacter sp. Leaf216]KQM74807.1 HxlR family transcriptional regulator [Pedobacter sp. Leaf216]